MKPKEAPGFSRGEDVTSWLLQYRRAIALVDCALTAGLMAVLLWTYWLAYQGGDYAIIIYVNRFDEFWFEIVAFTLLLITSLIGFIDWFGVWERYGGILEK